MSYSIDTSALLDMGVRYYPFDNFPSLWARIEDLIGSGRLIAPDIVLNELTRKADATAAWAKKNGGLFVPLDETLQREGASIIAEYRGLTDPERERGAADPFVIAAAKLRGFAVVTGELPRRRLQDPPKIPDVCRALAIRCISVLELIQAEGWRF